MSELFDAIAALTNPTRAPADPDDPEGAKVTVPSLWAQLTESMASSGGTGGASGGAPRSRPTVSIEAVSLVSTVQTLCERELLSAGGHLRYTPEGQRDTPAELRAVHAGLVPAHPVAAEMWTGLVLSWVRSTRTVLGLDPPRIGLPRHTRCIDCGARDISRRDDLGEWVSIPALSLVWGGTDLYPRITGVVCAACGVWRDSIDLHAIAEGQMAANLTRETGAA